MLFVAYRLVGYNFGKIWIVLARNKGVYYLFDILLGQLVVVRDFDKLVGRIDKEHIVGRLGVLQHHDAGGNGRPEKEVCG